MKADDRDEAVAFDLALLVDRYRHALGFRFEPADGGEDRSHGYDHIQLSISLGHRTARLAKTPAWLPDSYPAFPVHSRDMRDRFLAMALAMHGFPQQIEDVIRQVATGQSGLVKDCFTRINGMLGRGS